MGLILLLWACRVEGVDSEKQEPEGAGVEGGGGGGDGSGAGDSAEPVAQVTQPRITQILNLTHLAPDIQEDLLFLDPPAAGKEPIHERGLRPLTTELCWQRQRTLWTAMLRNAGINSQHRKSV